MNAQIGSEPPRSLETTGAAERARDEREDLVRWHLARSARRFGLRCVAAMIETAGSSDVWMMISDDFGTAHGATGNTDYRSELSAAVDASESLAHNEVERAMRELSKPYGVPVNDWVEIVRDERREAQRKAGAR